jgi:hypothetical protein
MALQSRDVLYGLNRKRRDLIYKASGKVLEVNSGDYKNLPFLNENKV